MSEKYNHVAAFGRANSRKIDCSTGDLADDGRGTQTICTSRSCVIRDAMPESSYRVSPPVSTVATDKLAPRRPSRDFR